MGLQTTTAANYAQSGLVNWVLSGEFVAGGVLGGILGSSLVVRLVRKRRALTVVFALSVIVVGAYILVRGLPALLTMLT